MKVDNIKPQVVRFVIPNIHMPSCRPLNLGCATGHPSFVMLLVFIHEPRSRSAWLAQRAWSPLDRRQEIDLASSEGLDVTKVARHRARHSERYGS